MEEKDIKIQVSEGYEIDKENSTFECIKFKPKKLNLAPKVIDILGKQTIKDALSSDY